MPDAPAARRAFQTVDGIVLLDKPAGLTSNAALQRVRRLFAARKAGHTGSLDPLATGMLPLCFGEATKFAGHLLDADKTYRVRLRFGEQTDTADADGSVVATSPITAVSPADIAAALPAFRGPISQVPPMYSALKQGGRRLYELARAGQELPRLPRQVCIHVLEHVGGDSREPILEVRCSKGTYIRSLVEDLAAALGTLAHVVALRRLAVAPFDTGGMHSLEALTEAAASGALAAALLPVDAGLAGWPRRELSAAESRSLQAGRALSLDDSAGGVGPCRVYGPEGRFLGVADASPAGVLTARRLCAP